MQHERASKRQQELLSFVDGFIKGNGYGPSYREIMRALGYKSVSTVAIHIDNLIAKGYLVRRDKSARSLEVLTLTPDNVRPASDATPDVERQLMDLIKKKELSDEEARQAAATFERLGLNKVVAALKKGEDESTV